MSLGRSIDHWGTNPSDAIDAALKAIETALHELLATDPAYWRTEQKKDLLERLEKLQAQQAALKLRVLASAGDIAEETGAKDASGWMRPGGCAPNCWSTRPWPARRSNSQQGWRSTSSWLLVSQMVWCPWTRPG